MIYPQNLPPAARFYWQKWLPACVKRAEVIVASSEFTRRDLKRLLGVSESRVRVVPLAAHSAFGRIDGISPAGLIDGLKRAFFLTVGTIEPRKNIPGLIKAYDRFKAMGGEAQLVLAGKGGGQEQVVHAMIRELRLEQDVLTPGYVTDEVLAQLYNACIGYVMPSHYEGFGLPVLEAMNCGKSGVCSEKSSLPEIAGYDALYVNPDEVEDIAEKMRQYESDTALRARLCENAGKRAREFTWDRAAKAMIEVFEETL